MTKTYYVKAHKGLETQEYYLSEETLQKRFDQLLFVSDAINIEYIGSSEHIKFAE